MIDLKHATDPISAEVSIPGSKSMTNRALLLAALSEGVSMLKHILLSDDTMVFVAALRALGVRVDLDVDELTATVTGCGGVFSRKNATDIWCQDAGTAARFLLAACAGNEGSFSFDGTERLRERPMAELVSALRQLGAEISQDIFPCQVKGVKALTGGEVTIASTKSSQYVSALLMMGPFCQEDLVVRIQHLKRRAYIDLTCEMMSEFGVNVKKDGDAYRVPAVKKYQARTYLIEPDLSTASYFFAAAAVTAGKVCVLHMRRETLKQGDKHFLCVLELMGCLIAQNEKGICIRGPEHLKGIEVDMQNFSDPFMTLACIAPFASSPTTITGIAHTRLQESDRIEAIASELTTLGVQVETGEDWIRIHPGVPVAAKVDSHQDHRIAMSLSLVALKIPGIQLTNSQCVAKTCPDFFERFDSLLEKEA